MKRSAVIAVTMLSLVACAAERKSGAPPPAAPASVAPNAEATPAQAGYPAPAPPPPGMTPPPMPTAFVEPSPGSRQASVELERSQRELDVAAGDCHNACRALSSMDRAAGRICNLSSGSDDDKRRCSEAKERVYSARDKVKSSCGQCSETSTDRNEPVPSTR